MLIIARGPRGGFKLGTAEPVEPHVGLKVTRREEETVRLRPVLVGK